MDGIKTYQLVVKLAFFTLPFQMESAGLTSDELERLGLELFAVRHDVRLCVVRLGRLGMGNCRCKVEDCKW